MKTVVYTSAARREFRKLPAEVQAQVRTAIALYAEEDRGDVLKLQGRTNAWRLRSGDWRVILALDGEAVTIEAVRNRREAY